MEKSDFNKRIMFMGSLITIFLFVLIGRLYNLSIIHNKEYASRIDHQLQKEVQVYYPRGKILDRNGIPFTGRLSTDSNLVIPIHLEQNPLAKHVIGQIQYQYNNNTIEGIKGVSGIQKLFDKELNGGLPVKIIQYKDGLGQNIAQDNYYIYGDHINQGKNIRLTLDYHIQKSIEESMDSFIRDKYKEKDNTNTFSGIGVVVMDVQSGEILGMASMGDQNNKALHSFQVGSVFKTIVAAKALEEGVVDLEEKFVCNGAILIDNEIKHCHKTEGHGEITFKEAFAQSCNSVFFEVAQRLNSHNPNGSIKGNDTLDLAQAFGFAKYDEAKSDSFILSDKYSRNTIPNAITCKMDVFNMALGQGQVEASPLVTTKIMATIANGGLLVEPTLLKDIIDYNGEVVQSFSKGDERQVIEPNVNSQLQLLLEEVTLSGTAQRSNIPELGGIAGKTGTAENGHVCPHAWFAGYFPVEQPKYAMTVFVEDGGSGSAVAAPLFSNIAKKILKLGQRN